MNLSHFYPVYQDGTLVALYPKNEKPAPRRFKLSDTTTARRVKCAVRRMSRI